MTVLVQGVLRGIPAFDRLPNLFAGGQHGHVLAIRGGVFQHCPNGGDLAGAFAFGRAQIGLALTGGVVVFDDGALRLADGLLHLGHGGGGFGGGVILHICGGDPHFGGHLIHRFLGGVLHVFGGDGREFAEGDFKVAFAFAGVEDIGDFAERFQQLSEAAVDALAQVVVGKHEVGLVGERGEEVADTPKGLDEHGRVDDLHERADEPHGRELQFPNGVAVGGKRAGHEALDGVEEVRQHRGGVVEVGVEKGAQ